MAESADAPLPAVSLTQEMGLTLDDFIRTLPNAVAPYRIDRHGLRFQLQAATGEGRVQIQLTELPPRRIASLSLPVLRVALRFEHCSEAQRRAFLTRFDLYFHKGGG